MNRVITEEKKEEYVLLWRGVPVFIGVCCFSYIFPACVIGFLLFPEICTKPGTEFQASPEQSSGLLQCGKLLAKSTFKSLNGYREVVFL